MRSSIEGLNQEIEGLVLKSGGNTTDSDHPVEDKVNEELYSIEFQNEFTSSSLYYSILSLFQFLVRAIS